jgi:triacylglycerol lipase
MIADTDLVAAAAATYKNPATTEIADIYVVEQLVSRDTVIAFRGSWNVANWIRDLDWAPTLDPDLGFCHRGFARGARLFMSQYVPTGNPVTLVGHSLGGALALAVGGIMAARGFRPIKIVTFGAPRVGMSKFLTTLEGVEIHQYRNGNDPVTELPLALWPFLFRQARPSIAIGKPRANPIDCHFVANYVAELDVAKTFAFARPTDSAITMVKVGTLVLEEGKDGGR